jgi:CheY-like chemotaxis protein
MMTVPARDEGRRVLVVDDNADTGELLVSLLTSWGHRAVHASDGQAALAIAPEFLPEVVLLDIGLPDLDGHEVARRLCQIAELDATWLIAMTGRGDSADRERARAAGFNEHMVKPPDVERLQRVILRERESARMKVTQS